MDNVLNYKGYFSTVRYSAQDNVLYGTIEGIVDLVTFESNDCNEIEKEFQNAVDDYLDFCQSVGKSPNRPYKGSFNVRISPELHRKADINAKKQGITLNQYVAEAIASHIEGPNNTRIIYYPLLRRDWAINNSTANYESTIMKQNAMSEVSIVWQTLN